MKYGVVRFPSKKLQDIASSYRKRYDPMYDHIIFFYCNFHHKSEQ
ncbi:hypothetical protein BSAF29S_03331 [Bacillus safensis subsp. safensis]